MKIYYQDKLKSIVEARYEQAKKDVQSGIIATLPPIIKFRNGVVRELFAAEPAEVHEEVAQFVIKHKLGQDANLTDGEDNESGQTVCKQASAYLKSASYFTFTM